MQSELDDQQDDGARFYDPEIGRWNVVDPAADYYPEVSPYAYVLNDPISYIDEDGEMPGPAGFVLGALSDYIGQVGNNYFFRDKSTLYSAMTEDINLFSIGISGGVGMMTGGIDAIKNIATKGVGQKIFIKMIDYGIDVLSNTMQSTMSDYLESGNYDFWKSLTGGLIQALPIKHVEKLQKKLQKNISKQAKNVNRAEKKLRKIEEKGLSQTRIQTYREILATERAKYDSYNNALYGVKTVYDAFKGGGTSALTDALFKKPTPIVTAGEPEKI